MRIAILSDTHGRLATVQTALRLVDEHQVEWLLHCGDIDDVDTVWLFPANTHFVFGNCDYDRHGLRQAIAGIGATLHEPFGQLELAGVRLAFLHGDNNRLLGDLESSGQFAYLFHGHTHQAVDYRRGPTRVINPGALYRAAQKTLVILDLAAGVAQTIVVV